MDKKFEKFTKSKFGLEIYSKGKLIFRSRKEGIAGLLEFIGGTEKQKNKKTINNWIIFDKKVGNAAALLCVYMGAKEVYGSVGSKLAEMTFKKFKIKFHFLKTIPKILNKKGSDVCPWEKLSQSKTPKEFYESVKSKQNVTTY